MCQNHQLIINSNISAEKMEEIKKQLQAMGVDTSIIVDHNNEPPKKKTFSEIAKDFGMNDKQVKFLQHYSRERSRRAYEKVAIKEIGNNELISDWVYAGCYDAGHRGAEYCSAGHALRYVHIAKNVKTGKEIKFGIVCVRDFFNLTDAQIKMLKNGFAEANEEIQDVINTFVKFNGDFNAYEEKYQYKMKLEAVLEYKPSLLKFDTDDLEHLFKLGLIRQAFNLNLPIPFTYAKQIYFAYREMQKEIESKQTYSIDKNDAYYDILVYLNTKHSDVFTTIMKLRVLDDKKKATEKQQYFLHKLLNTKWHEFDQIADDYHKKTITINNSFYDIFNNILNSYIKYGGTDKQLKILKKAIKK